MIADFKTFHLERGSPDAEDADGRCGVKAPTGSPERRPEKRLRPAPPVEPRQSTTYISTGSEFAKRALAVHRLSLFSAIEIGSS
jgi:hypothetical protein